MPKLIATRFTSYEFTAAELYSATRYSDLTVMLIQTLIATAALRRTNITFDPADTINFAQQEAEIKGEIGILEHLLTLMVDTLPPEVETSQQQVDVSKPATQTQPSKPTT